MSELHHKVDMHFIRYASCWEDADILLSGIGEQQDKNILCIASAGDNGLALLSSGAASVHLIDVSEVQLCLMELKLVAFYKLEYEELLRFLGVRFSSERDKIYTSLSAHLSPGARKFWNANPALITNGVIHSGKFESYFKKFRSYFLPLVHSKKMVKELLRVKPEEEQQQFYETKWNTWRWKMLLQIFFSRKVMGKYGRDPEFLKHVEIPVSQYIRNKAEAHLRSSLCCRNYFLHAIFTGDFGPTLPFYLRPENFETIRSNIHKLSLSAIGADEAVRQRPYQTYCFSNIFEYGSKDTFNTWARDWSAFIPQGAKLAYWNLMAPRSFSEQLPQFFRMLPQSSELTAIDKGFFYSRFLLEEKI